MIELDSYEIPEHISYSAFNTYVTCGYQYYLSRLLKIEDKDSIWSIGGRAFHEATEMWDKQNG